MNNKIYDIIPPEKQERVFKGKKPKKKKSHSKEFLIGLALFFIVAGLFSFFQLPQADLKIWPQTTSLSFKELVIIDQSADKIEFEDKIIPGELVEAEEEAWLHKVDSTGVITEDQKSRGKIKVYNEHTPFRSVNLITGTRFLSEEGKYFISLNPVHVPAARQEGSEIIPGVVEIEVVAQEPGEDHNIGPSEFSIPGLAGMDLYYTLSGRSEDYMKGGEIKETKYVTQADVEEAEKKLREDLVESVKNALKKEISEEFVMLEEVVSKDIRELAALVEVSDKVDQFTAQGTIKGEALVFNKNLLREFAKEYLSSRTTEEIFEESLRVEYFLEEINLEEGKIVLNLEFSAKTYSKPAEKQLFELVEGKRAEEVKNTIFLSYPEIRRVEVDFWPFWVNRLTGNKDKVNIELIIE